MARMTIKDDKKKMAKIKEKRISEKVARGRKNYNDLIKRKDPKTGEIYYVEKWVHPTRT